TVDGLITDCGDRAAAYAEETGAFNVSTLQEPYRIEGKKTMMLEIVEALGGGPDVMVYPTGGGVMIPRGRRGCSVAPTTWTRRTSPSRGSSRT
ncbi:MAG: pyridoxal-phosphate dependent enzyme, partial [Gemmatimonadota bacterium]